MTLRGIDPSPLRARYSGPASEVGERPELQWLKIARLRIDPRYQREIGRRGVENILSIATKFQWRKFTPVIVAPIGQNLFAIVDGQHRTTAACLRGFEAVPCVIISADEAAQADAFVAINGSVTAMTPLQLHAARLAAGDAGANALTEVCHTAGVKVCRYPIPANKIGVGETLAISALHGALKKYGRDVLVAALCCITKTRRGNAGMIRAQIIDALCVVLEAEPNWHVDRKRLIFAMQTFDFTAQFNAARTASIETGAKVSDLLVASIGDHLNKAWPAASEHDVSAGNATQPVPPPSALKGRTAGGDLIIHNGISISLIPQHEAVAFNGISVKVSPRGARLIEALARVMPSCIGDDFLIGKLWQVKPVGASSALDMVVRDLAALKKCGLEVRTQRGVGRQLVELK